MPESKPIPTGDGDILTFKAVRVKDRNHPTEKPVDLLRELIKKSSKNGDVILDCFTGSGSTLIACKTLKRKFIGFEKSLEYFKIAENRIREHKKQNTLTEVSGNSSHD